MPRFDNSKGHRSWHLLCFASFIILPTGMYHLLDLWSLCDKAMYWSPKSVLLLIHVSTGFFTHANWCLPIHMIVVKFHCHWLPQTCERPFGQFFPLFFVIRTFLQQVVKWSDTCCNVHMRITGLLSFQTHMEAVSKHVVSFKCLSLHLKCLSAYR